MYTAPPALAEAAPTGTSVPTQDDVEAIFRGDTTMLILEYVEVV
jgi:hypothetical protein